MAEAPIVANRSGGGVLRAGRSDAVSFCLRIALNGPQGMGRRPLALLLFVAGYVALATLEPLVAAGPALTSFVAATLLLAREPAAPRI